MNTMFGKDDGSGTGARQGAFLSKAYNFVTGKISDVSAGGPGQGFRLLKNRRRILGRLLAPALALHRRPTDSINTSSERKIRIAKIERKMV